MRYRFAFWALVAPLMFTSCSSLVPGTMDYDKLKYPGYFDIGAGYGRVIDTRNTSNDDAEGAMVSFKAYPLGRWYGEPKEDLITGMTLGDRNAISQLHQHHEQKTAHAAGDDGIAAPAGLDGKKVQAEANALLRDVDKKLSHSDRILLQKAASDDDVLTPAEVDRLDQLAREEPVTRNWMVVRERDSWYNRLSVFYGRSISDFNSGGLTSGVNTLGIGYDVSPDLAIQAGIAFYEVDEDGSGPGGSDSDSSFYFGMSLNLNSFRQLATALTSLK